MKTHIRRQFIDASGRPGNSLTLPLSRIFGGCYLCTCLHT